MMTTIASILEEIDQLKPISDIAGKVLTLLNDPDCGMSDLADIIRHEPALTANLLKLANSAYFGLPGKIEDAKQAIVYLGMTQVVDLVLMVSCGETFKGGQDGYGLSRGALWRNAVCAAIVANDLTEKKGLKCAGLTFTGALLRDIGKVAIDQYVKSAMPQIIERATTQHTSFMVAERQVLGLDHAQVGALLAKKWNLPPLLQCIIRYYHTPLSADGCFTEASIVYLADAICRKMEISLGVDDASYGIDERIGYSLGLDESAIQTVMNEFHAKMDRVSTLFHVV